MGLFFRVYNEQLLDWARATVIRRGREGASGVVHLIGGFCDFASVTSNKAGTGKKPCENSWGGCP